MTYQEDTSVAAGTILAQDVAEGTSIDSISAINVTVANASAATAEPTATPTATPTSIATATPAATPTPTPATATPAPPAPTQTPTLGTPSVNISIDGTTINVSWGGVSGATSYTVSCAGSTQDVSGTSAQFTVSATGDYSATVVAHGGGFLDSAGGTSTSVHYDAPQPPAESTDPAPPAASENTVENPVNPEAVNSSGTNG